MLHASRFISRSTPFSFQPRFLIFSCFSGKARVMPNWRRKAAKRKEPSPPAQQPPQAAGQELRHWERVLQLEGSEEEEMLLELWQKMAFFQPPPPCYSSWPPEPVTNLDRLLKSVSPLIPLQNQAAAEIKTAETRTDDVGTQAYFWLGDVWESFKDWSMNGAGVSFLMDGQHLTIRHYSPFLSGIQLYIDHHSKPTSSQLSSPVDRKGKSVLDLNLAPHLDSLTPSGAGAGAGADADADAGDGVPFFQYLESAEPCLRKSLTDKIYELASECPGLIKFKSSDLLPSSWLCVAWYPNGKIPDGPNLNDFEASFLTFHPLSTQFTDLGGGTESMDEFRLGVSGLVTYRHSSSVLSPCGPCEQERELALAEAAHKLLSDVQVTLPDHQLFHAFYSNQI